MFNIKTNSKKINKGDIFLSITTPNSNGDRYIEDAIKRGASKIIATKKEYDIETIVVKDTRIYLENYLKENYNYIFKNMKIIGITGTNGKTTICTLLKESLDILNIKCAYLGTTGFHMDNCHEEVDNTTPDICDIYEYLYRAYENNVEYFILEVSSHALEQSRVETINFDYAIFTNLTHDHLDFHKTMENYMKAKQKLFYKLKDNGIAIINQDDNYYKNYLLDKNKNILYSKKEVKNIEISTDKMKFAYLNNTFETSLIGEFNISNILAVLKFLESINIDILKIKTIIKDLIPPNGRIDIVKYNSNKIIIDYAHTPDAIIKIIEVVNNLNYNNLYIIFGCTGERDKEKRPIMGNIVEKNCKKFIITNDDIYFEEEDNIINDIKTGLKSNNYVVIKDRYKAIKEGISYLDSNDILLILGKGHETVLKVKNERIHFNDKECVLEIIDKK